MKKAPITLDVSPVQSEVLGAAAFLKLAKENPTLIKSSTIVHPKQGQKTFGDFFVEYTRPQYKQAA